MLDNGPHGIKILKSFVKTNDTASIRCPECALARNVAVAKFRHQRHTLKTRCPCGYSFMVALDFRRHYRKPTSIIGTYSFISPPSPGGGQMKINNISRSGMAFSVPQLHLLNVGQKALLTFRLDNKKQTELNKRVLVRNVQNNTIGCEFINQNNLGKDLGFFLQP